MSVNKLWTLICNKQEDRVSTFGLVSSPTRIWVSTKFSKSYIKIMEFFLKNTKKDSLTAFNLKKNILAKITPKSTAGKFPE